MISTLIGFTKGMRERARYLYEDCFQNTSHISEVLGVEVGLVERERKSGRWARAEIVPKVLGDDELEEVIERIKKSPLLSMRLYDENLSNSELAQIYRALEHDDLSDIKAIMVSDLVSLRDKILPKLYKRIGEAADRTKLTDLLAAFTNMQKVMVYILQSVPEARKKSEQMVMMEKFSNLRQVQVQVNNYFSDNLVKGSKSRYKAEVLKAHPINKRGQTTRAERLAELAKS